MREHLLEWESAKTLILLATILMALGNGLTAIADEKTSVKEEVVLLDVDNMT